MSHKNLRECVLNLDRIHQTLCAAALALLMAGCAPDPNDPPAPQAETPIAAEPAPAAPAPAPAPVIQPKPKPVYQAPAPKPVVCADCGTVSSIVEVRQAGSGSGAGAAAGAIAGGVAGHQFGGGRGKDVATAVGAIAGAIAGHQIEKQVRASNTYDVTVSMDDGSSRMINVVDLGGLQVGTKVRVDGANLILR